MKDSLLKETKKSHGEKAIRTACTECQRRKQKCNREWPCNHCQRRKVADKCRFINPNPSSEKPEGSASRKRRMSQDEPPDANESDEYEDGDDNSTGDMGSDTEGFEALGYAASHIYASFDPTIKNKPKPAPKQYYRTATSCPQLERAIALIPDKPVADLIMRNFLDNVNFHYYIVYPPSFREAYDAWWVDREHGKNLGLQWTCLLLTALACSVQQTDLASEQALEAALGEPLRVTTNKFHNAARELQSVIPSANYHILNVQQQLYSCYWFKTEARFIEAWHVLSAAVREAQELGIHQEALSGPIPDFDLEIRRRVWCNLDVWDWMLSELVNRPMSIDRSDCDVALPSLPLEGYSPSPHYHMKARSDLFRQIYSRFGHINNVASLEDVQEYGAMLSAWLRSFPPVFDVDHPDTTQDASHSWLKTHRHQLHTAAYQMLLEPLRPHVAISLNKNSSGAQVKLRNDGVECAMRLLHSLFSYLDCIWPKDFKFPYVLFSIFDTGAVLSSALLHDVDHSIPNRPKVYDVVGSAVEMLGRLKDTTKMGRTSYKILARLRDRLAKSISSDAARARAEALTHPVLSLSEQVAPSPAAMGSEAPPLHGHTRSLAPTPGMSADAGNPVSFQRAPDACAAGPSINYNTAPGLPFDPNAGMDLSMPDLAYTDSSTLHPSMPMVDYSGGDLLMPSATYMDMTYAMSSESQSQHSSLGWTGVPEDELALVAAFWKYQSLDLGFSPPTLSPSPPLSLQPPYPYAIDPSHQLPHGFD